MSKAVVKTITNRHRTLFSGDLTDVAGISKMYQLLKIVTFTLLTLVVLAACKPKVGAVIKLPDNRDLGNLLTQATFQYWEIENDFPPSDIMRQLPDYNSGSGRVRACTDASVAVRKAVMLDDMAYAGELTNYLLGRGYGEAGFVRVCKAYSLCVGQ